jgi:hypothetical protein
MLLGTIPNILGEGEGDNRFKCMYANQTRKTPNVHERNRKKVGQPNDECCVLELALAPQEPHFRRGPHPRFLSPTHTPKPKTIPPGLLEKMIVCMVMGSTSLAKSCLGS